EPYYAFQLELPDKMVGRAMTDISKMNGTCKVLHTNGETAVLAGSAPVAAMRNYQKEVTAYTKGLGRLFLSLKGYETCHNSEEVIESIGYDSDMDAENPAGSVFCTHGAGFSVPWDKVKKYMHVESYLREKNDIPMGASNKQTVSEERWISLEEIDRIINKTYYGNQGKKSLWKRRKTAREIYYEHADYTSGQMEIKEEYLLVDGYNIIHAWPELKELADGNIESARMKLLDSLSNYQWIRQCRIIVVFDAYRVQGHREEITDYHNIHIVYTKEAQTADEYIEKFARDNRKKYNIAVATSDGLQQIIVRGAGCSLLSARELKAEIEEANRRIMEIYQEIQEKDRNYLIDALPDEARRQIEALVGKENETNNK
ncbi:MAG: translation elongation factor G, partial [Gracilibacteraceae bacterium]|nr:translation elongation factor G [Gracilibacteraceae bacterium]